jgi:hypothetical protein
VEWLEAWLAHRGLDRADLERAGATVGQDGPGRWVITWPYRFSNGTVRPRLFKFSEGETVPEKRWGGEQGSPAKGAVLVLGDPQHAKWTLICEGESDALRATAASLGLGGSVAAVCMPGSSMVPDDLANFLGNGPVVIATDADTPGDEAAERARAALDGAGVERGLIRRLRPNVPGLEKPDLRDLLDYLGDDPTAFVAAIEAAPVMRAATTEEGPFALPLDQFIAEVSDTPASLLGEEEEPLLPAAGLALMFGRGGKGKTTLMVEAALHMAAGVDWLGIRVPRPIRVLFIENEGPREPFRRKLDRRVVSFGHAIPDDGAIFIYTKSWGAFTLGDIAARRALRDFIEAERIDLVIGDPLSTLGMVGSGAPDETRAFVALMVEVGLNRDVAFWLLHHPRKEKAGDEIDQASGDWGGKPDLMLQLDTLEGNRARLSFPKHRWSRSGRRRALVLAFDPETEAFSVVAEEVDERDLAAEIEELLRDGKWRTVSEIAARRDKGGIGAGRSTVKDLLEADPLKFMSRTGAEAKAAGRSPTAVIWQLLEVDWASSQASQPSPEPAPEEVGLGGLDS